MGCRIGFESVVVPEFSSNRCRTWFESTILIEISSGM